MCFLTAQLGGEEKPESKAALNVLELLSRDDNSPLAGWGGVAGAALQLWFNPIAIPCCRKPVPGVRTGLVLLLSVLTRGLEQQRPVPCWKVQPEKDANDTQRGMNVALESCCA